MRPSEASLASGRKRSDFTQRAGRPALAALFKGNRATITDALVHCLVGFEKYEEQLRDYGQGDKELLQAEVGALADFLALLYETGDTTYRHLYIGEMRKVLYFDRFSREQQLENAQRLLEKTAEWILRYLGGRVSEDDVAAVQTELQEVARVLTAEGEKTVRVLLVGDCVFMDLLAFATVPLLEDGVTLEPTFATSKNPATLKQELRRLTGPFDAVFYSPFTYSFSLDYSFTSDYRNALASEHKLRGVVERAVAVAEDVAAVLADTHECPIYVHNSADVRRHDSHFAEVAKCILTRKVRARARVALERAVEQMVRRLVAAGATQMHVFDETPVLATASELELGRKFYDSPLQHPTVFSRAIAAHYRDVLAARAHLFGRKIIVTDLDNTLWRGLMGEGPVEHFRERQQLLRRLRSKGVVLAVASKNDADKIRWEEMALAKDDFVATRIDWRPKAGNIREMQQELELRPEAFVFIDDRPDERALAEAALPGLRALDAEDDATWRHLARWEELLDGGQHEDRTRWYRERASRGAALEEARRDAGDDGAFAMLELKAVIRDADAKDLARVLELINRSNQFNLCGTRTTSREVRSWLDSPTTRVLVADVSDRFGGMGLVGIAIVNLESDRVVVPAFVLSCRVFGYAVETALLQRVARYRAAGAATDASIVGRYHETKANGPCKAFYADHGFTREGEDWVLRGSLEAETPHWLTVSDQTRR